MNLKDLYKAFTLDRKWRIERHITYLRDNITIPSKVDKENAERIYTMFIQTKKRHGFYSNIRNIFFVLLYVSVIIAYTQSITPWLSILLGPIAAVANVIGFGALALIVLYFQRLLNMKMTDLLIQHSHLIAIYSKHNKTFIVHPHYTYDIFDKSTRD